MGSKTTLSAPCMKRCKTRKITDGVELVTVNKATTGIDTRTT